MPGKMLTVPAIEGWRYIDGPVDERCIERHRDRQESKGTDAKCVSQCEGIKGTGCQPGDDQCDNQQTVIVNEREKSAGQGEQSSCKQQDAAWTEQTSEEDGKGPDKHEGPVIGAVEPCPLVVTNADMALEICHPERKHASGEGDESGSDQDPDNPQERPGREFRGDRGRRSARNLHRC